MLKRRFTRTAAAASIAAVALAACGSTSSSNSSSSNAAETSNGQSGVAGAKAAVSAAEALPQFTLKAASFNARNAAAGKLIFNIPSISGIPFYDVGDAEMKRIAQSLGAKWVEYPNQGSPQEWAKGIEEAIAEHASVISLGGTDPNLNIPQLQDAKRAGIPVVETQIYNTNEAVPGKAAKLITAQRTARFTDAATLDAQWAIAQSNGNAHILVSTSDEQPPNPAMDAAIKTAAQKYCPKTCTVKIDNVPLTDWGTKITPTTESSLVQNPDINWVIPIYDAQTDFVTAAIRAAGRNGRVKIATYNGSASTLKEIQKDSNLVSMDVGENLYWLAWANMDVVLRALAKAPQPKNGNEETPARVFWGGNVSEAGTPARDGVGYGNAYVSGYNKLWGTNIPVNPASTAK